MKIKQLIVVLLMSLIGVSSYGQTTDSLSHYLVIAAQNNPSLKADFLTYQASLQRVPQAGAYADPTLDIGVFIEPMDIMDGRQVADFTVMQMFNWFGTRKAARQEMTHMAKASFEKFRETRNNLYLTLYSQWFMLCNLQQKLINSQQNHALLIQLEELALRRFSSPSGTGPGGMSYVMRIQLEQAELESNVESVQSEIRAQKAQFNALLNRSAQSELAIPDSFEQISYPFDEASMDRVEAHNPVLEMILQEGEAYKAKAKMDRKMSYPMFGIGLQYMLIKKSKPGAMGATASSMDGMDMVMPMVSLTIPIYRKKYSSQQRESNFLRQASEQRYNDTRNALETELYQVKHQLDDASRRVTLYKKQSELAQTTYNLVVQEFVTGKSDLTNVLEVQRQLLEYQLKQSDAVASYNTMVASMLKLISFNDTNREEEL